MNKRGLLSLFVITAMLAALFVAAAPTAMAANTLVLPISEDTFINPPNTAKHGGDTVITVAGNNAGTRRHAYVKFAVTDGTTSLSSINPEDITTAKIRMYCMGSYNQPTNNYAIFEYGGIAWTEANETGSGVSALAQAYSVTTCTNGAAMSIGASSATALVVTRIPNGSTGWFEWDITNYIKNNLEKSSLDFVIASGEFVGGALTANVNFVSKEGTAQNAPQLVVTYAPKAPVTVSYLDSEGNALKDSSVSLQDIGSTYTIPDISEVIITQNKIYSFNASISDPTTFTVAEEGNTVNLRYEVAALSSFTQPETTTSKGYLPELPDEIEAVLSDGKTVMLPVTWEMSAEDYANFGYVTAEGYITGATDSSVSALVNVNSEKFIVTKDTYVHPTSGTTVDSGPGTALLPVTNTAPNKGSSAFMVVAYGGSDIYYMGETVDPEGNPTYSGSNNFGSARNGLIEFSLPEGMSPNLIKTAKIEMVINKMNNMYTSGQFAKVSLYETGTEWDEYTVVGTSPGIDKRTLAAISNALTYPDYGYGDCNLPLTFDITDYLKGTLEANPQKTEFAFRMAMATYGFYAFTREYNNGQYAPYLIVEVNETAPVTVKYVDTETGTEIMAPTTEIGAVGYSYTYTKTPPAAITYNGENYYYNAPASVLTIDTVSENAEENVIVLAYKKRTVSSIAPVNVTTYQTIAPVLPAQVDVVYDDGSAGKLNVVWDEIPESSYNGTETFNVEGTVETTDIKAAASVSIVAIGSYVQPADIKGFLDVMPHLPDKVTVIYADDTTKDLPAQWDEIPAENLSKPGTIKVGGTIVGAGYPVSVNVLINKAIGILEDTFVESTTSSPYGTFDIFKLAYAVPGGKAAADRWPYIKFKVPNNINMQDLTSAKLVLKVQASNLTQSPANDANITAYKVNDLSWSENTLVFANAPAYDETVKSTTVMLRTTALESWIEIDIKSILETYQPGDIGALTLRVDPTCALSFYSTESVADNVPYISFVAEPTAMVTVMAVDAQGNTIKELYEEKGVIGWEYTATNIPQFMIENGKMYSFDPSSQTTITVGEENNVVMLRYNEVSVVNASIDLITSKNRVPVLPSVIDVELSDGTTQKLDVIWDSVDGSELDTIGEIYTVNGTIAGTSYSAAANIKVAGIAISESCFVRMDTGMTGDTENRGTRIMVSGTDAYTVRNGFIKVDTSGINLMTAGKVMINLKVADCATRTIQNNGYDRGDYAIYAITNDWSAQTGFDWASMPQPITEALDTETIVLDPATTRGTWVQYDVTEYVLAKAMEGQTVISFVIQAVGATSNVNFYSEGDADPSNAPYLSYEALNPSGISISGAGIKVSESGGIDVSFIANNGTNEDVEVIIILAAYSEIRAGEITLEKMEGLEDLKVTIPAGTSFEVMNFSLNAPADITYTINGFIWDNYESMSPYVPVLVLAE